MSNKTRLFELKEKSKTVKYVLHLLSEERKCKETTLVKLTQLEYENLLHRIEMLEDAVEKLGKGEK